MFFLTLYRAFKLGWQNFWRNRWLSLVTVLILILTLFLISLLVGVKVLADQTIETVKEKVDLSIYFEPKTNTTEIMNIQTRLEEMAEVKSVEYISPDQALSDFREKNQDNPNIIETLESLDENPLGAVLVIRAKELEDYPSILTILEDKNYEDIIQDKAKDFENNQVLIERLSTITENIDRFGLILIIIFISVVVIVIFNTIRITIYSYREEIGIMKLVGASNNFVKAPFVIESLIYSLIASLISFFLLYSLVNALSPFIDRFYTGYELNIVEYFNNNAWLILTLEVLAATLLSVISSLIAIRRYLKV